MADTEMMLRGQALIARELVVLPAGTWILSIGEGDGHDVVELARAFPALRFAAFDIDAAAIAAAAARTQALGLLNVHLFVADIARIPIRDGAAGFAYARGVIHIVPDPDAGLREMARASAGPVVLRDIANWPLYPFLRLVQAATLWIRGRSGAAEVLAAARRTAPLVNRREHALQWQRWAARSGQFRHVSLLTHDLLWWDLDADLGLAGLVGARFGIRCTAR